MTRYIVEFVTADAKTRQALARRAARIGGHAATRDFGSGVRVTFTAADNRTARTLGLVIQGDTRVRARIKVAGMFGGPWFDLNEDAPAREGASGGQ